MERIIWSNMDLNIEDYADFFEDEEETRGEKMTEYEKLQAMADLNDDYLGDEKMNLNQKLDGRICVIADLGFWDGRRSGYKIMGRNLADILSSSHGCDFGKFYFDGHNVKFTGHHHDGTHYLEFREIREDRDIEVLTDKLYLGEEVTRAQINYYTKSLGKRVKEIYGW